MGNSSTSLMLEISLHWQLPCNAHLFLTLHQSPLDLVWVQGMGMRQAAECQFSSCPHHVGVSGP